MAIQLAIYWTEHGRTGPNQTDGGAVSVTAIARSLRTPAPDRNVRRQRLLISAARAVVFVASVIGYMVAVGGDDDIGGEVLLAYNAVGVPSMIAAVAFLIAGLLAPRRQTPTS